MINIIIKITIEILNLIIFEYHLNVISKNLMLMTKISLKYAFKNFKICKYMPLNISYIPVFEQINAKNIRKKGININLK
jgi:hypothetical protein